MIKKWLKEKQNIYIYIYMCVSSLQGNLLTGKEVIAMSQKHEAKMPGRRTITVGKSTIRPGQSF